ncbi:MAG: DUF3540 domain-containing protein [candidate division Zixibacteria bacterium]|nr:DUF3540 domain-containing protein [candidate division Zixibacteria bacterium]
MDNLARKHSYAKATQEYGKVLRQEDKFYSVETDSGLYRVMRAVGCVVQPEVNDLVLVSLSSLGGGYILAVLEREQGAKATLSFDSDVDIRSPEGSLSIASKQGIDLASPEDINLVSSRFGVSSSQGEINISRLTFLGSFFEGSLETIKLLARTFDAITERFFRRTKRSYRFIEDTDQVKAGSLNYIADKSLMLRGTFSQMTAKEDVHIDAERINIG